MSIMSIHVPREDRLPQLTEQIIDAYADVDSIYHLGSHPLPNREAVVAITEDLRDVLYPGYRRRDGLHLANLSYYVGTMLGQIHERLVEQIARALHHGPRADGASASGDEEDHFAAAQVKAIAFLEQLPGLRRILALDLQAAYQNDPSCRSRDEIIFCYPGLAAVTVYRLAHLLHRLEVPLIPRMMTEWAHQQTGIEIHPGASIGRYFFIDHGTGVVIGETCVIGDAVKLYQGVTLGAISVPADADGNLLRGAKRHPTLGDRVIIYANATILGGETTVGHDTVIGANAWVTRSVEPHSTVSLDKPRMQVRAKGGPNEIDSDWSI